MTRKINKKLLFTASVILSMALGFVTAYGINNKQNKKAKQAIEARFDKKISSETKQIQHERDSLHNAAYSLFGCAIRDDDVAECPKYGVYIFNEKEDKNEFLWSVTEFSDKKTSDFYSIVFQDLVDMGYNDQNVTYQYYRETYRNGVYDLYPVDRHSVIDKEDIANYEKGHRPVGDSGYVVPPFTRPAFQKRQNELDKICVRLHALDEMEQSVKKTSALKDSILAEVARCCK